MLEELTKKDKTFRQIAFYICKNKSLADDFVQDMYLKIIDGGYPKNERYARYVLKSVINDHYKERRIDSISIEKAFCYYLKDEDEDADMQINDEQLKILNDFEALNWKEKELIKASYNKSYRQLEKDFPSVSYQTIYKIVRSGLNKLLKDSDYTHKNTNLKYKNK